MLDPITTTLKMQQAAFIGACCAANLAAANLSRLMRGEQVLLFAPGHRRAIERHKPQPIVTTGPSWTDHYGKRSHDVDVEHMR
jgi:hypothetical protein